MFETSFVTMCVGVCKIVRDVNGSLLRILCSRNNFNNEVIWIPFKDFITAVLIKYFKNLIHYYYLHRYLLFLKCFQ